MTTTQSFARQELDILEATVPDALVTPFRNEILALCEAFGRSGQSGGSAPYVASAITQALNKLLLQSPICEITGHESEWVNVSQYSDGEWLFQNSRCSSVFKSSDGICHYIDAIVFQGEDKFDTFTGAVYKDDTYFELIGSSQNIKLPFTPKTFYVDVVRVPISKKEAESRNLHFIEDKFDKCYYTIIKDPNQLKKVFEYYDFRRLEINQSNEDQAEFDWDFERSPTGETEHGDWGCEEHFEDSLDDEFELERRQQILEMVQEMKEHE